MPHFWLCSKLILKGSLLPSIAMVTHYQCICYSSNKEIRAPNVLSVLLFLILVKLTQLLKVRFTRKIGFVLTKHVV